MYDDSSDGDRVVAAIEDAQNAITERLDKVIGILESIQLEIQAELTRRRERGE